MDAREFERRLRALAKREGLTFATFASLKEPDLAVLVNTIVRRFDAHAVYREREVNALLKAWLATAGAMVETDHVNMRRWLVDSKVLARTPDCAEYKVHPGFGANEAAMSSPDVAALDPSAIVAETRRDAEAARARRKAGWLARSAPDDETKRE